MSIDPNVGALKEYLTDITTSQTYNKFKDDIWKALGKLPGSQFSREIASLTREQGIQLRELLPEDESLESVFAYLVEQ